MTIDEMILEKTKLIEKTFAEVCELAGADANEVYIATRDLPEAMVGYQITEGEYFKIVGVDMLTLGDTNELAPQFILVSKEGGCAKVPVGDFGKYGEVTDEEDDEPFDWDDYYRRDALSDTY